MHENLPAMIAAHAAQRGDHPAMRFRSSGQWREISYGAMNNSIQAIARGLLESGLAQGDRVGIISGNRPAWSLVDFGILRAGGVVVPIYPSSTATQLVEIVQDSGLQTLFVGSNQELATVREAHQRLPQLNLVLVFDDESTSPAEGYLSFADWAEAGETLGGDGELARRQEASQPGDLATIVYTSGTTGEPKGVMLCHANIFHQFRGLSKRFTIGSDDRSLCFLPLSHIFERTWTYYVFHLGAINCYLDNPKRVMSALTSVKPTVMTGVPRLYEKIHATMYDRVERGSASRRRLFQWSMAVGLNFHTRRLAGRFISPWLKLQHVVAEGLVLRKVRAVVGGHKNFFAAGGAPLAKEIEETFLSAGVLVCQGYGLTETSPTVTCNFPEGLRLGTVGRPLSEVEVRIGKDEEIQVRGPNVMLGYWNKPEATAAAFTEDGWFKTGDIGSLDPDGFLRVTDRLKEIIVTSGGKNVAPAAIEMMVGKDHYIEQIAVVGEGQKYLAALVTPSFEALEEWAKEQQIRFGDRAELLRHHRVVEFIRERIDRQSANLAGFERIRRFHLLEDGFSLNKGEITPTLKLKRKVIQEHYKDAIGRLFKGR